ncbi:MAG: formylglycine-generating enzyme family protein [Phycisphaerales bacterium]
MPATADPSIFDLLPACASSFGDDEFGVWCEIAIEPVSGGIPVVQRLRWIEPGEFWMGSPETEAERSGGEGPRHRVTLTRGFWLADTACTQAMWSAVTGKNPSRFKGDDRPVEQVSWHDVRAFLDQLSALLPECETDLPTEAEWEYACRAGTETPFSFGETITPEQVNYDGNFPYAGGAKGLYRKETVPVKSFPANRWGLYEMHGNVWEWCADGKRRYAADPVEDRRGPEGGDTDVSRVVRGGSWIDNARGARSAIRHADDPGHAFDLLGFRFCLRSVEPQPSRAEPARESPAEQAPRGARGAGR